MAGGAATTAGVRFQDNVAAWFAVRVLADSEATPVAGLPGDTTLEFLLAETTQPTDDLNVGTSGDGRIFIQAKTSLPLSTGKDAEFRKVIDQFVRQAVQGCPADAGPRPFDPARDRLVLAVSSNAPATIRTGLRNLLRRLESASPTTLPDILAAMGGSDRSAYDTLRTLFNDHWTVHSDTKATDADFLAFVRTVYILVLDLTADGADTRAADELLRHAVLHNPAQAGMAWTTIAEFCRNLSPERTGADREYLRQVLLNAGVALTPPRSYDGDIAHVNSYSRDRLEYLQKLSAIKFSAAPGEEIKLIRTARTELAVMAEQGHLLVIGDPGAGKSGGIHDVADEFLRSDRDVLVIPVDRLDDTTSLRASLGLARAHSVADLLVNWSGEEPAFVFLDALDAARTRGSLQQLCSEMEDVMRRAPRWHVVTSIREFDLQHCRDAQRIFAGAPHATLCSPRFGGVRHLHVPLLDDNELCRVREQAPAIGEAFDQGGTPLSDLARNLFNLRLLADLVEAHTNVQVLGAIRTQLQLLDLYWIERAEGQGPESALRHSLLSRAVDAMVRDRLLSTSKEPLVVEPVHDAACLANLLSDGVLVETDALLAGGEQSVSFAHNILFDYAVARLSLRELELDIIQSFTGGSEDLLLAIRPSLDMAFQRLWHEPKQPDRRAFWDRAFAFQATRLVGRIIPAGVAATSFGVIADLQHLLDRVAARDQTAASMMGHVITAAVMLDDDTATDFSMLGEEAAPWMELASILSSTAIESTTWQIRALLAQVVRDSSRPTETERIRAGASSRALLEYSIENPEARGVLPTAMHVVCTTVHTDPQASVALLSRFLEDDELTLSGHQTLEDMTEHLVRLVEGAPEFALRLAAVAFRTYATRDEQVPMGGRIVTMMFNKHDMLEMARHHVADAFPDVMRIAPMLGVRIAGLALVAHHERNRTSGLPNADYRFPFAGGEAVLRPDYSYMWQDQEYVSQENWFKVLRGLHGGLCNIADTTPDLITQILACFRESFELAAGWSILLEAAAEKPGTLGVAALELLTAPAILAGDNTRVGAGRLLESVYPILDGAARRRIEEVIVGLVDVPEPTHSPEYTAHCRDRLLGCIPRDLVETDEARRRLVEMESEGAVPEYEPESFGGFREVSEDEHLTRQGVDIQAPQNRKIRELTNTIKDFKPADQSHKLTATQAEEFLPTVLRLDRMVAGAAEHDVDPRLAQSAHEYLIECCERMANVDEMVPGHAAFDFVRSKLLSAVSDPVPVHSDGVDERWDADMPSWGSPSPRISAATGLMSLAFRASSYDDEVRSAICRLAGDPHPAVRYQIAIRCGMLWHTDRPLMWGLIEQFSSSEPRLGLLAFFLDRVLLCLGRDNAERAESLVRRVYQRVRRRSGSGKVRKRAAVFFLRRAVWDQDGRNTARIAVYSSHPKMYSSELGRLLAVSRDLLVRDDGDEPVEENTRVRTWTINFLRASLVSILRNVREVQARYADGSKWQEDDIQSLRTLHGLARNIGDQVYFASGAFADEQGSEDVLSPKQLDRYAHEVEPLLNLLCEVEFVDIAYSVMKTLQYLAPARPTRVFQLLGRLISNSATEGIHYESMATDLVVSMVEQYLAERRELFRDDVELRNTLLDVLDRFVEAGWPKATRLTFRLSEVFR